MPEQTSFKVIYLIQTDQGKCPYKIPEGSDVLMLQWQKDFEPNEYSFHFPNSTYQTGRNELYRRAIEKSKQNGYDYVYLIFMDDDLKFNFSLKDFEKELNKHRPCRMTTFTMWFLPPIYRGLIRNLFLAKIFIRNNEGINKVKFVDHNFMALRIDCAEKILPYTLKYDTSCWWASSYDLCLRFFKLFKETIVFNKFYVLNKKSRPYPRDEKAFYDLPPVINTFQPMKTQKNQLIAVTNRTTEHCINFSWLNYYFLFKVHQVLVCIKKIATFFLLLGMTNKKESR